MGRAGGITPSLFSLFLEEKDRMDCTKEKLQVTLKKKNHNISFVSPSTSVK